MLDPGAVEIVERQIAATKRAIANLREAGFSPAMIETIERTVISLEGLKCDLAILKNEFEILKNHPAIKTYSKMLQVVSILAGQVIELSDDPAKKEEITSYMDKLCAAYERGT